MNFSIPLLANFLISAASTTESWLVKMTIGPDPVSFHLRDPNAKGMHALPLCGNDGKRSSNWASTFYTKAARRSNGRTKGPGASEEGDMKRRQFITALSVAQPNAIGVIVGR